MLVQVCVRVCMATAVRECGSMRVQLSICLHVGFFYEKAFPVVLVLCVQELYLATAVTVMSS